MAARALEEGVISEYISSLSGVDVVIASKENGAPEVSWGTTFFFYDPERRLEGASKFPFATIVSQDYGEFDNLSDLNRKGVYRLNIGVSRKTYDSLFPSEAETPDFSQLDVVMPHPLYGGNHWVCVLNPSAKTFESIKPLLAEAHSMAAHRYAALSERSFRARGHLDRPDRQDPVASG